MDIQTKVEPIHPVSATDKTEGAETNRDKPSIDNHLLKPISTPMVTVTEIPSENEDGTSQTRVVENANEDPAISKIASLTPSGPPETHQQFSMQEFKRSFYHHWIKDRSVEKSDPYGFSSANASRSQSRSPSPNGCSYSEAMARRGSIGGTTG